MLLLLLSCGGPSSQPTDSAAPLAQALADAGPDLEGFVGETLTLDGSASQGLDFLWDMGDGSRYEGSATASHAWSSPGTYAAVLQVTGEDGGSRADTAVVRITNPPSALPPVSSAPIRVDAERGRIWFIAPEASEVGSCDLELGDCRYTAVCTGPQILGLGGPLVGVSCPSQATVQLLDAETGELRASIDTGPGSAPYGIAGREGEFWVALQGTGELLKLDESGVLERSPLGLDPRGLVLGAEGEVWASRWRSPDEGAWLYRLRPGQEPETFVLPIDQGFDSDTTSRGVPNLIEQFEMSPDGGSLLVGATQANILRGLWRDGQSLSHDTALRATVSVFDIASQTESRKQLDERGRSIAVVPSPRGDLLFAVDPGVQAVTVLDAQSLDVRGSVLEVGAAARGLAVHPEGHTLYVHGWLEREIRAYDLSALPGAPPLLAVASLQSHEALSEDMLEGKRLFWAADSRITRSGYISCASCHPDGRDDGRTWDFTDRGEGLRNTTSLATMGTGAATADPEQGLATGRLHWSGNFDEAQDFENDIRTHFGGSGLLAEADWKQSSSTLGEAKAGRSLALDQLATYLHSLAWAPKSGLPADEAGEAAFVEAGCGDCHQGALFTDSQRLADIRHDVGTLGAWSGQRMGGELDGLDTPTLIGVWDTAPYLHDGSAPTLEEAILAHESGAGLEEETVEVIAAWLRGL